MIDNLPSAGGKACATLLLFALSPFGADPDRLVPGRACIPEDPGIAFNAEWTVARFASPCRYDVIQPPVAWAEISTSGIRALLQTSSSSSSLTFSSRVAVCEPTCSSDESFNFLRLVLSGYLQICEPQINIHKKTEEPWICERTSHIESQYVFTSSRSSVLIGSPKYRQMDYMY